MSVCQITPCRHGGIVVASQPVKLHVPVSKPEAAGLGRNLIYTFYDSVAQIFAWGVYIGVVTWGVEVTICTRIFENKLIINGN